MTELFEKYEAVIGLEVHVELATETKLFCNCPNSFGSEPNTNVCPVCLGLPGSLPVLNAKAVEFAHLVSKALNFSVPNICIFHRKNYFYPDMPKDFQTSQFDTPICFDGYLEIVADDVSKKVNIQRAHLEEDTGKSTHIGTDGRIHNALSSLIDYNRAGVPLLEIVTYPDIQNSSQAKAYVSELRAILETIKVSDVKMEEGSMRVDANVSIRLKGATELGTRTEIKNMNSIRSLGRAVDFEIKRQIQLVESGKEVIQETRHWSEVDNKTHSMRSKEEANDYRYFPEPDLMPVISTDEMLEFAQTNLPMLPQEKRQTLVAGGVAQNDAITIVDNNKLFEFYNECFLINSKLAKNIASLCVTNILSYLNDHDTINLDSKKFVQLLEMESEGKLSKNQIKTVVEEALITNEDPIEIVESKGMQQNSDQGALEDIVDQVISQNQNDWEEYITANSNSDDPKIKKLQGFFMGKCMALSKGQGNPGIFVEIIKSKLS